MQWHVDHICHKSYVAHKFNLDKHMYIFSVCIDKDLINQDSNSPVQVYSGATC